MTRRRNEPLAAVEAFPATYRLAAWQGYNRGETRPIVCSERILQWSDAAHLAC
jgi:hypothetical protein